MGVEAGCDTGTLEYRVRWANFGSNDDTWQTPSSFNSVKPIKDYWHSLHHSG
jgi:hypothetical protein